MKNHIHGKIELPKTTGLCFIDEAWKYTFYRNGKRVRVSAGTEDFDAACAWKKDFVKKALEHGATYRSRKVADTAKNPDLYIRKVKPFQVTVNGVSVGGFDTKKQAREARDAYLQSKVS